MQSKRKKKLQTVIGLTTYEIYPFTKTLVWVQYVPIGTDVEHEKSLVTSWPTTKPRYYACSKFNPEGYRLSVKRFLDILGNYRISMLSLAVEAMAYPIIVPESIKLTVCLLLKTCIAF